MKIDLWIVKWVCVAWGLLLIYLSFTPHPMWWMHGLALLIVGAVISRVEYGAARKGPPPLP